MRNLAAIVLIVAGFAIPACAQRGGAHGGFSGHGGGGFSGYSGHGAQMSHGGGPARSAPGRPAGSHAFPGSHPPGPVSSLRPRPPGNPVGRRPYPGGDRGRADGHRRRYISPYGYGTGYPYYGNMPLLGGYDPYLFGSGDNSENSNAQAAPSDSGGQSGAGDYAEQPPEQGQSWPSQPPYPPLPDQSRPTPAPVTEEPVTLVFKDGRPPEQIHNFLLTRTTLYVQDQNRRTIPVDQIDIAATEKTNQDSGIDFRIPKLPN